MQEGNQNCVKFAMSIGAIIINFIFSFSYFMRIFYAKILLLLMHELVNLFRFFILSKCFFRIFALEIDIRRFVIAYKYATY